jgi:hypothetical protein
MGGAAQNISIADMMAVESLRCVEMDDAAFEARNVEVEVGISNAKRCSLRGGICWL